LCCSGRGGAGERPSGAGAVQAGDPDFVSLSLSLSLSLSSREARGSTASARVSPQKRGGAVATVRDPSRPQLVCQPGMVADPGQNCWLPDHLASQFCGSPRDGVARPQAREPPRRPGGFVSSTIGYRRNGGAAVRCRVFRHAQKRQQVFALRFRVAQSAAAWRHRQRPLGRWPMPCWPGTGSLPCRQEARIPIWASIISPVPGSRRLHWISWKSSGR
jgi:hypothetical protein